jgi:hypothetical protein
MLPATPGGYGVLLRLHIADVIGDMVKGPLVFLTPKMLPTYFKSLPWIVDDGFLASSRLPIIVLLARLEGGN